MCLYVFVYVCVCELKDKAAERENDLQHESCRIPSSLTPLVSGLLIHSVCLRYRLLAPQINGLLGSRPLPVFMFHRVTCCMMHKILKN